MRSNFVRRICRCFYPTAYKYPCMTAPKLLQALCTLIIYAHRSRSSRLVQFKRAAKNSIWLSGKSAQGQARETQRRLCHHVLWQHPGQWGYDQTHAMQLHRRLILTNVWFWKLYWMWQPVVKMRSNECFKKL